MRRRKKKKTRKTRKRNVVRDLPCILHVDHMLAADLCELYKLVTHCIQSHVLSCDCVKSLSLNLS
jgi:hypothetical protein